MPLFKATFNGALKTIVINDNKGLSLLVSNIGKMIPLGDRKSIDVRLMITFYYKQTEIKYCMNRFGVFVDSAGRYLDNKLLYGFIIGQLPAREIISLNDKE